MTRYNGLARTLHWIVAPLVFLQIATGWLAAWERNHQESMDILAIHYHAGISIGALMVVRSLWSLATHSPSLLHEPRMRRLAATWTHGLLYALLITMPFSGYVIWVWMDAPMSLGGVVELPELFAPPPHDETGRAIAWYIHAFSSYALMGLLALHIAAALYHEFILRDRLVRDRML
jgi:cytochrome b561